MIYFLLLSLVTAQTYTRSALYEHQTRDSAQAHCESESLSLCSKAQLYAVVYDAQDSYGAAGLCYSGWLSDDRGWWTSDVNSCSGMIGWNDWIPEDGSGAHCCSGDVPSSAMANCADHSCPDGQIRVEGSNDIWCADGNCVDGICCKSWEAAADYRTIPGTWDYVYTSGEDARDGCKSENEDWDLCTKEQVEGIVYNKNQQICSAGWWRTGDGYGRGWYVSTQGDCDTTKAGLQDWVQSDGSGTAHCCTSSYHKNGYGDLAAAGYEDNHEGAAAYCQALPYPKELCSTKQLETVAATEDMNQCASGYHRGDDNTQLIGWWQGIEGCGGSSGYRSWVADAPVAHCCSDYVVEPELADFEILGSYSSGYVDGAAAAAACTSAGYEQLCTQGQVAWWGTNEQTDLCTVGWASTDSGFIAGFWNTETRPGCGKPETWNGDWIPTNPTAFCCAGSVEAIEMQAIVYYNGDYDYSYTTKEAAQAMCRDDFSLCTMDQLYTIATEGVVVDDNGNKQTEPNICRIGWTEDAGMGWWQGTAGDCGEAGWRTFDTVYAGYHCCTNFAAKSTAPTGAPTAGVFHVFEQLASSYLAHSTMDEAKQACEEFNPSMSLCSAAQIVEAAVNGAEAVGDFLGLAPQTELCYTSWVDTEQATCDPAREHGFFSVLAQCGGNAWEWNNYLSADGKAGAFCCHDDFETSENWASELGCAPETSLNPTLAPVEKVYFELTDQQTQVLGLSDDNAAAVYIKNNQYFYKDSNDMYNPTCVAASDNSGTSCDFNTLNCAGFLRRTYGTLEEQGVLLNQALAETDNVHQNCPPQSCTPYNGYSPSAPLDDKVNFCSYNGCYYMNGMETCVCDSAQDVNAALQNVVDVMFDLSECPNPRPFDEIMDDQLGITNLMVTDLETQISSIPDVNTQLQDAQEELKVIWGNWETEITATVNAAIATAEGDGNTNMATQLSEMLDNLRDLSPP